MDMQAPEASADIGAGFRRIAVARAQPLPARQPCPDVAVGEAVQALISVFWQPGLGTWLRMRSPTLRHRRRCWTCATAAGTR